MANIETSTHIAEHEFRLGNWYLYLNDLPSQVASIEKNRNNKEAFPIPLTPEILEKAAFEKHEPNSIHTYISYTIWIENISCFRIMEHKTFESFNYTIPCYPTTRVYYVHQLQNLYFALTNQELEITL